MTGLNGDASRQKFRRNRGRNVRMYGVILKFEDNVL